MDVREGSEELIDEKLDLEDGHDGLHFVEEAGGAVNSLRDEFENEVEVNLIFLQSKISLVHEKPNIVLQRYAPARRCCNRKP